MTFERATTLPVLVMPDDIAELDEARPDEASPGAASPGPSTSAQTPQVVHGASSPIPASAQAPGFPPGHKVLAPLPAAGLMSDQADPGVESVPEVTVSAVPAVAAVAARTSPAESARAGSARTSTVHAVGARAGGVDSAGAVTGGAGAAAGMTPARAGAGGARSGGPVGRTGAGRFVPDPHSTSARLFVAAAVVLVLVACVAASLIMTRPQGKGETVATNRTGFTVPSSSPSFSPSPVPTATVTERAAAPKKKKTPAAQPQVSGPAESKVEKPKKKVPAKKAAKKPAPIAVVAGNDYQLRNVATGHCMELVSGLAKQGECASAPEWKLQPTRVADGVQLYWLRTTVGEQKCLDLPAEGIQPQGTQLSEHPCVAPSGNDNQEWQLEDVGYVSQGRKSYALVNKVTGTCLDVANWAADKTDRTIGHNLGIYQCHSSDWGWDDHLWTFD